MQEDAKVDPQQLCASCDRCRSRKTKCDGKIPCSNCAAKYMKKNKLTNIDGVEIDAFECIYSPAKRRGPTPGRPPSTTLNGKGGRPSQGSELKHGLTQTSTQTQPVNAEWQPASVAHQQLTAVLMSGGGSAGNFGAPDRQQSNIQQQLNFLQQQMQQQAQQMQQQAQQMQQQQALQINPPEVAREPDAQRRKVILEQHQQQGIPRTIMSHTHLLDRGDPDGSRLRAYYKLSVDEMFRLPCTPSDEEHSARMGQQIPGSHLAALSAARFAEMALGAIVHNEVGLAMELCNAVVHCLRESVQEPVDARVMYEVAKAYFLLGVFRAYRGDMARYFKYRRVGLTYLSKLEGDHRTHVLLAAVAFLDSWAYMIYNAIEDDIPDVDGTIPPIPQKGQCGASSYCNPIEAKFGIKTDVFSIASDPKNKNWIQGAPVVYLNNEAPMHARFLDAIACAVRSCCDQANIRFAAIVKENDPQPSDNTAFQPETTITPTATAVLAHENELCSRNLVLSAFTMMRQHESNMQGHGKSDGQHLIVSAMDAFLENGDDTGDGGFTDSQIQSLLSVCNSAVENPLLLHHAGPTYHMVSNAAVLLCHLLNGMYLMKSKNQFGPMEATMFEEVLDTFVAVRKLLTIHRRKLPVKLRCHGIPRPSLDGVDDDQPFIDLGETLLCPCRGCQGFVLMACSPCVAAERARSASSRLDVAAAQETEAAELGEVSSGAVELRAEFDLDDDALLSMISDLIAS